MKVGYEVSFTRYFYKPMRTLPEIREDILALERETEGLLAEIPGSRRTDLDCNEDERKGNRR